MLRPFTGQLLEENFQEVLQIIHTLSGALAQPTIDREMVSNLWSIVYYTRLWAIDEDGMLRRNGLLTEEQVEVLTKWVSVISEELMNALEDENPL